MCLKHQNSMEKCHYCVQQRIYNPTKSTLGSRITMAVCGQGDLLCCAVMSKHVNNKICPPHVLADMKSNRCTFLIRTDLKCFEGFDLYYVLNTFR